MMPLLWKIPVIAAVYFAGTMIGHIDEQFTIPLGIEVEIDAVAGTIELLEPGVT